MTIATPHSSFRAHRVLVLYFPPTCVSLDSGARHSAFPLTPLRCPAAAVSLCWRFRHFAHVAASVAAAAAAASLRLPLRHPAAGGRDDSAQPSDRLFRLVTYPIIPDAVDDTVGP